jgi:hypothetical protein
MRGDQLKQFERYQVQGTYLCQHQLQRTVQILHRATAVIIYPCWDLPGDPALPGRWCPQVGVWVVEVVALCAARSLLRATLIASDLAQYGAVAARRTSLRGDIVEQCPHTVEI